MDQPADRWLGLITHEVAHIFGFDILPGSTTPVWISEGLAEYERGVWDPNDLVTLREAVRAGSIPKMSGLQGNEGGPVPRLVYGLGHAAFDFIESRWGKPGVRQFLLGLRQSARGGGDPYESAFQIGRDEFDRAFEGYLKARFPDAADQSPAARFDLGATVSIEGDVIAIGSAVPPGLACLELSVGTTEATRQHWAVECADAAGQVMPTVKPGDRVIVTGSPTRKPGTQRVLMRSARRL
jgi:hypothetical protein